MVYPWFNDFSLFKDIVFYIGLAFISFHLYVFLKTVIAPSFFSEGNVLQKYGPGSWGVVTGASAGIGKEFCFQLAQRGFNVVLIAKNPEKTRGVEEEINQRYPSVKTKVIISDFRNSAKEGFFEDIMRQLEGLDISILVNNVGIYAKGFHDTPAHDLKNVTIVNCLPQVMMSRYILPKLLERKQKSAIINMASIAATFPRTRAAIYSATKVFNDYLSRGLRDLYPNIDIISLRPKFITSQMTDFKKPGIDTSHPASLINNCFAALGKSPNTSGDIKHRFIEWRYLHLPSFITGFR
jgi:Short-chain dehydrogenases of various substrate specificities